MGMNRLDNTRLFTNRQLSFSNKKATLLQKSLTIFPLPGLAEDGLVALDEGFVVTTKTDDRHATGPGR